MTGKKQKKAARNPAKEVEELRAQLIEAQDTLRAIRSGEVDALVVATPEGDRIFTMKGAETPYRIIVENISEGAVTLIADGVILYANAQFSKMLRSPLERIIGTPFYEFVAEQDRKALTELFEKGLKESAKQEVSLLCCDDSLLPVYLSLRRMPINDNKIGLSMVITDISERKRAEEMLRRAHDEIELRVQERTAELKESEERYHVITESATDAIITIDEESRIILSNPAAEKMFGYTRDELHGNSLTMLMPERLRQAHLNSLKRHIATGKRQLPSGAIELPGLHKDGREIPVEISYGEFAKHDKLFFIGIIRDITERKKAEETINYQAYHDLLTGLPNRAQFMFYLEHELAEARRDGQKLAVLYIDLDRFKVINDSLGHVIGDKVLLGVAERFKALLRKSDTLARIGSDEFIILLNDISRAEDAVLLARKIVDAMRKALPVNGTELYVTASVGISMYPEDSKNAEGLLKNAHIAASHVKERGRDNYQFFNLSIDKRTVERLLLESSLRQTLEHGELVLYFQPQVNIRTGEILCLEALVRWKHSDLGLLFPSQFIPIAEEIGFIPSIDEWVLRAACAQINAWQESGYSPLCVTVNLSAQQFQQPTFLEKVSGIVHEMGIAPGYLNIEITESTAMRDVDIAIPNLKGLHNMGINLSIDDFGTGYSSLNYLKQFPVYKLKIDKSFIAGLPSDPDDQAIVKAVIAMGHNLKMRIVAEGVETDEQLSFLRDNECDEMQGYLFSEPLPVERIEKLLTSPG